LLFRAYGGFAAKAAGYRQTFPKKIARWRRFFLLPQNTWPRLAYKKMILHSGCGFQALGFGIFFLWIYFQIIVFQVFGQIYAKEWLTGSHEIANVGVVRQIGRKAAID